MLVHANALDGAAVAAAVGDEGWGDVRAWDRVEVQRIFDSLATMTATIPPDDSLAASRAAAGTECAQPVMEIIPQTELATVGVLADLRAIEGPPTNALPGPRIK